MDENINHSMNQIGVQLSSRFDALLSLLDFTKKYAGWIAEDLKCEVMDIKDWRNQKPADYQTVIYGGGFYAGSIKGLKKIKEQMKAETSL